MPESSFDDSIGRLYQTDLASQPGEYTRTKLHKSNVYAMSADKLDHLKRLIHGQVIGPRPGLVVSAFCLLILFPIFATRTNTSSSTISKFDL